MPGTEAWPRVKFAGKPFELSPWPWEHPIIKLEIRCWISIAPPNAIGLHPATSGRTKPGDGLWWPGQGRHLSGFHTGPRSRVPALALTWLLSSFSFLSRNIISKVRKVKKPAMTHSPSFCCCCKLWPSVPAGDTWLRWRRGENIPHFPQAPGPCHPSHPGHLHQRGSSLTWAIAAGVGPCLGQQVEEHIAQEPSQGKAEQLLQALCPSCKADRLSPDTLESPALACCVKTQDTRGFWEVGLGSCPCQ